MVNSSHQSGIFIYPVQMAAIVYYSEVMVNSSHLYGINKNTGL